MPSDCTAQTLLSLSGQAGMFAAWDQHNQIQSYLLCQINYALGGGSSPVSGIPAPANLAPTIGALSNQKVIAVGANVLYSVTATSRNANRQWLMVWDLAAVPANGTVPQIPPVALDQDSANFVGFGDRGVKISNGIAAAVSTTPDVLTLGASDTRFAIQYL